MKSSSASGLVCREFHEQLVEKVQRERDCAVARAKDLEAALGRAWDDVLHLRDVHLRMEPEDFKGLCRAAMGRILLDLHPPPPPPTDRADPSEALG